MDVPPIEFQFIDEQAFNLAAFDRRLRNIGVAEDDRDLAPDNVIGPPDPYLCLKA